MNRGVCTFYTETMESQGDGLIFTEGCLSSETHWCHLGDLGKIHLSFHLQRLREAHLMQSPGLFHSLRSSHYTKDMSYRLLPSLFLTNVVTWAMSLNLLALGLLRCQMGGFA